MNLKCRLRRHDWTKWYNTQGRASGWLWTRQCRRCGRWQCRQWVGLVR